jgi:hypothetical protein
MKDSFVLYVQASIQQGDSVVPTVSSLRWEAAAL